MTYRTHAVRDLRRAHWRRGGYLQPPLLKRLAFQLSLISPFNPFRSFPMSTSSRAHILIRIGATVTGDIAAGVALASACVWLIQAAALGLFLSFLLWLLAFVASLAISQHVVHPVVHVLLSDRKLDGLVYTARRVRHRARAMVQPIWQGY